MKWNCIIKASLTLKEPGDDALLNYVYNKQQEALCAIVDEINGIQTSMEEKENLTPYLLTSHFFSISFLVLASSISCTYIANPNLYIKHACISSYLQNLSNLLNL